VIGWKFVNGDERMKRRGIRIEDGKEGIWEIKKLRARRGRC
jgi:hypothetical protein